MSTASELAAKMRESLNKRSGRQVTSTVTKTEELTQVDAWVEMPYYFQRATGGKGLPIGHITQIVGKSDTGKTTMVMDAMVRVQQSGGIVYLIDSEHKFSFERFAVMGGRPEEVIVLIVDSLEEAWNALTDINADVAELRKQDQDTPVMIVWDSVAASVPDKILDSEAEDAHVSVDAKINNKEIRKLRKRIRDNRVVALFIGHTYFTMPKFGIAEEVIKGGSEMFFMSTLILKTKRRAWLKRTVAGTDEKFGVHSLLEVFKGHLGGVKAVTPFYIVGQGILEDEDQLSEYKELIEGINGLEVNQLSLEQLRARKATEVPIKKPKKKKEEFIAEEDDSE